MTRYTADDDDGDDDDDDAAKSDRVDVRAVMLGAVGRVAERLVAAVVLAEVRPLASVRANVNLEVLQPRERLTAAFALHHAR